MCRVGANPVVSSAEPHYGEEPPLVGTLGSGTIFMTYCNLKCVFCQNYDISHLGDGTEITIDELASEMLKLQNRGCHNINFVSPTHQIAQIVAAVARAADMGLEVPLVYNSGGYESAEVIKMLDGVFDIYMPDIKYGDDAHAKKFSAVPDYVERALESLKEMHRQVGDLVLDAKRIAQRGLLIRHLVLPEGLANTKKVMTFIAEEISKNSYVNIMDQYRPCFNAGAHPPLDRRITRKEYEEAVEIAKAAGIRRIAGVTA